MTERWLRLSGKPEAGHPSPRGQKRFDRRFKNHGKGTGMSVLAAWLGRAVYLMNQRHEPFDMTRFLAV